MQKITTSQEIREETNNMAEMQPKTRAQTLTITKRKAWLAGKRR
jgi:hypothetical protein